MAQSHIALQHRTRDKSISPARCSDVFPLTPALSPGERVNAAPRGAQSKAMGSAMRKARCSLSLRERVRVRGNGANPPLAFRTIPATIELGESSGEAGGLPNDNEACLHNPDHLSAVRVGRVIARFVAATDADWRRLHHRPPTQCSDG